MADTAFQIITVNQEVLVSNVTGIERTTEYLNGRPRQGLRVRYMLNSTCRDTTIPYTGPLRLHRGTIGLGSQIDIALLPACEYYGGDPPRPSRLFAELGGIGAYTGATASRRRTDAKEFMGGGRALAGAELLTDVDVAIGLEGLVEQNRLRLPLLGHVRWYPFGREKVELYFRYVPDTCRFGGLHDTATIPADRRFVRADASVDCDTTVYFIEDVRRIVPWFRPFLYAEGAYVFNGGFEGAGAKPALNPEDYGQYFGGAGIGMPLFGPVVISVGYRYMRLNNRTPCESCPAEFVVNTNTIHAATVTFGLEFR